MSPRGRVPTSSRPCEKWKFGLGGLQLDVAPWILVPLRTEISRSGEILVLGEVGSVGGTPSGEWDRKS